GSGDPKLHRPFWSRQDEDHAGILVVLCDYKMGVFRHGRPDFGVALEATFSTGELEGSGRQLVVVQRVQGYVLALLQNSITKFDIPTVVPGRHCDLPQDLRTD